MTFPFGRPSKSKSERAKDASYTTQLVSNFYFRRFSLKERHTWCELSVSFLEVLPKSISLSSIWEEKHGTPAHKFRTQIQLNPAKAGLVKIILYIEVFTIANI